MGLEASEACQRSSHSPQLQMCSTRYGSGTAAPSRLHLPRERHPPNCFSVVEAPCPGPSSVERAGGGGGAIEAKMRQGNFLHQWRSVSMHFIDA